MQRGSQGKCKGEKNHGPPEGQLGGHAKQKKEKKNIKGHLAAAWWTCTGVTIMQGTWRQLGGHAGAGALQAECGRQLHHELHQLPAAEWWQQHKTLDIRHSTSRPRSCICTASMCMQPSDAEQQAGAVTQSAWVVASDRPCLACAGKRQMQRSITLHNDWGAAANKKKRTKDGVSGMRHKIVGLCFSQ
jgi:hypothetical protein